MADVMTSNYRFTEVDDDGNVTKHRLRVGDSVDDLPKAVRKDLKERKLIRDEKWLNKDGTLRSAEEVANDDVELPRETPIRTPSQLADNRSREEAVKQAKDEGTKESKSSKKG